MATSGLRTGPDAATAPTLPWLSRYPDGVDWSMALDVAPLYRLLDDAVRRHGPLPCTVFLGKTLTYAEIGRLVDQAAAGLQRLGVKKGTKVGLLLPNTPTFIVYFFAVLKAGGTVVNFNPLYTVSELAGQIKDSDTELMITLDLKVLFDKVDALLQSDVLQRAVVCSFTALLPGAKAALFRMFKAKDLARPPAVAGTRAHPDAKPSSLPDAGKLTRVPIDPLTDVAVLQYTGGTTGTPKGAMLTHANIYVNVQQVASWAPELADGEERVLGILPFFHVFALTVVMNFGIAKGAEIIIMPRFTLDEALHLIDKTRPTVMPGVPTLFNALMNHPKIKSHDLSLTEVLPLGRRGAPPRGQAAVRGDHRLQGGRGLRPVGDLARRHRQSARGPGRSPAPSACRCRSTIVSLRDLADPTKEVPQGEKGEICIKGPQVMLGYYKRPQETAEQMVGEFLRTGDVARMDEEGFFFIEDRIKDLIISSGFNVYPRRIEEAIYEHAAVAEVTVIGIKDAKRGEAPKAFVRLKPGATVTVRGDPRAPEAADLQDRDAGRDRVPRRAAQDHDRQALQEGAQGRGGGAAAQEGLRRPPLRHPRS